jgi:prepilin-type N-terminal cleavage/methylation domain-containing protein
MSLIRRRLSREDGFTLPEVMAASVIGVIVLLAAFMLLDRSFKASGQVADRADALQRGRQAMELMTRQLRSQVCVGATNAPMVSGGDSTVTFYSDLSDGSVPVRKRTLTWDPTAQTITESVVPGVGTYPALTFTGTAVNTTLLTKAQQVLDAGTPRPVFQYYGYNPGAAVGTLQQLSTPLSAADLLRVAVIKVSFRSFAERPVSQDNDSTVLEDDVYIRVADPTSLSGGPRCA